MPSRILRDSYLTSPTIAVLTALERDLFVRLWQIADDHGRFDASRLAARCFPVEVEEGTIRAAQVRAWLACIVRTGAVALYVAEGRDYGVLVSWEEHQRVRDSKPRYPAPPEEVVAAARARKQALRDYLRQPAATCREWRRLAASGGDSPPMPQAQLVPQSQSQPQAERAREAAAGRRAPDVTRGDDGYVVPPTLQARWQSAYPGVDVAHELAAAWEWEQAHPERRKVRLQAFLVAWLKRAQDRGPARRPDAPRPRDRPAILDEQGPPGPTFAQIMARIREEEPDGDGHGDRAASVTSDGDGADRWAVGDAGA